MRIRSSVILASATAVLLGTAACGPASTDPGAGTTPTVAADSPSPSPTLDPGKYAGSLSHIILPLPDGAVRLSLSGILLGDGTLDENGVVSIYADSYKSTGKSDLAIAGYERGTMIKWGDGFGTVEIQVLQFHEVSGAQYWKSSVAFGSSANRFQTTVEGATGFSQATDDGKVTLIVVFIKGDLTAEIIEFGSGADDDIAHVNALASRQFDLLPVEP